MSIHERAKRAIVGEHRVTPLACDEAVCVHFNAGSRSCWHVHPGSQTLICVAGKGRVQLWGGEVQELTPGVVVNVPAGTKHWHGASTDEDMTHVALNTQGAPILLEEVMD